MSKTNNQRKPKVVHLGGYRDFTKFVNKLPDKGKDVFFFFSGKSREEGKEGKTWCIYCLVGRHKTLSTCN